MPSKNFELLEYKIQETIQYIKELKRENQALRTDNDNLQKQYTEYEQRIQSLEGTIVSLRDEHSLVENQISNALRQLETLEDAISLTSSLSEDEEPPLDSTDNFNDINDNTSVSTLDDPLTIHVDDTTIHEIAPIAPSIEENQEEDSQEPPFESQSNIYTLQADIDEIDLLGSNEAIEEPEENANKEDTGEQPDIPETNNDDEQILDIDKSDVSTDDMLRRKTSPPPYPSPFEDENTWNINTEEEEVPEEPEMF